jgi:hypothetical protein
VRLALALSPVVLGVAACGGVSPESPDPVAVGPYTADVGYVFCGETTGLTVDGSATRHCTAHVDVTGPVGTSLAVEVGDHELVLEDGGEVPVSDVLAAESEFRLSFQLEEPEDTPEELVLELDGQTARIPVRVEETGLHRADEEQVD